MIKRTCEPHATDTVEEVPKDGEACVPAYFRVPGVCVGSLFGRPIQHGSRPTHLTHVTSSNQGFVADESSGSAIAVLEKANRHTQKSPTGGQLG